MRRLVPCLLVLAAALGGCRSTAEPSIYEPIAVKEDKFDVKAFEQYIATKPLPEAFYSRYPNVKLVLPGDVTTKEFRIDRSRYFAELDAEGRIVGGRFQ